MSFFFFFKQKTAYEMRISDWSSDVCSSDLLGVLVVVRLHHALEFRSGVANDGLATALDRLADTIQLQGVLDRRIQRLDHLVRRILRCKQSDPGTQLISLNAGLGDGWNIGQALGTFIGSDGQRPQCTRAYVWHGAWEIGDQDTDLVGQSGGNDGARSEEQKSELQ